MRKAILAAFIVVCLALAGSYAYAQSGLVDPLRAISYPIEDDWQLPALELLFEAIELTIDDDNAAVTELDPVDNQLLDRSESDLATEAFPSEETPSDLTLPDVDGSLEIDGEPIVEPDLSASDGGDMLLPESEVHDDHVLPAVSGSLTRLLSDNDLPKPLQSICADDWDPLSDGPRQVVVPEEACYVRVMSEGRAAVREVRSLDLCPGRSSLRLLNIPASIVEDSLYLYVWNAATDVVISSHRLISSPDSVELLVEVAASDQVVGASLEVNYLTDDLYASLSYSGLFDGEAASLRLSEWLTVTNRCGKQFDSAMFSFRLSDPGYEHKISPAVTLAAGEQRRFLCRQHSLSPARTIITAENAADQEDYEITELIKVEGLQDQNLLIPSSPVTVYSMDSDGYVSLMVEGGIDKPREYSWFTVETLDRPDVAVQRAKTDDGVTGAGGIRDVSYMVNIDNRSTEDAVVTIYEYMGSGDWIVVSATVDARPISHSRDLSRREYATFTVQVPANSSRALFYRARISER